MVHEPDVLTVQDDGGGYHALLADHLHQVVQWDPGHAQALNRSMKVNKHYYNAHREYYRFYWVSEN